MNSILETKVSILKKCVEDSEDQSVSGCDVIESLKVLLSTLSWEATDETNLEFVNSNSTDHLMFMFKAHCELINDLYLYTHLDSLNKDIPEELEYIDSFWAL